MPSEDLPITVPTITDTEYRVENLNDSIDFKPDYRFKMRKGRSRYKPIKNDPLFQSKAYLEWRAEILGEDVWEYPRIKAEIPF